MTWALKWRGRQFVESDIKGADLFAVQLITGDGWKSCDPLQGPIHAANLTAAMIARTEGADLQDVIAEMAAASADEVMQIVSLPTGGSAADPPTAPSPSRSPRGPSKPRRSSTASPTEDKGPGTTPEDSLPEAAPAALSVA